MCVGAVVQAVGDEPMLLKALEISLDQLAERSLAVLADALDGLLDWTGPPPR